MRERLLKTLTRHQWAMKAVAEELNMSDAELHRRCQVLCKDEYLAFLTSGRRPPLTAVPEVSTDESASAVQEPVWFENARAIKDRPKALCCLVPCPDGISREVWVPWSQLRGGQVNKTGETGRLVVTAWITQQPSFEAIMASFKAGDPTRKSTA